MGDSVESIPAKMREKHDAIWALVEPFCRERLDDEYLELCRLLLGRLACSRPSPLVSGTVAAWACGIVRTVGFVNFLDDRNQKLHMKLAEVDKAFGVSSGTGQGKSKAIRDLLKIDRFEPVWTLPSKLADNPLVWMLEVNGMIVDIRWMPREIQEEALERGLIPFLPGEQKDDDEPEV